MDPTNTMLMAYADGELGAEDRAEIEAAIARDPGLRERLNRFVITRAPIAALYDRPMREPVPPHVVALIMRDAQATEREALTRGPARYEWLRRSVTLLTGQSTSAALAACGAVLLISAGAVWYTTHTGNGIEELASLDHGQTYAKGALARVLEGVPSGTRYAPTGDEARLAIEAQLTFKNHDERYCRQYSVAAAQSGDAGIACRADDGRWRIEVHTAVAPPQASDHAAPAGHSASPIEDAVSQAMEGDALGPDEEQALIRGGWQQ